MKTRIIAGFITLVAAVALAAPADLFQTYEQARQALIRQSVAEVKTAAKQLANEAKAAKQPAVAREAEALAAATDVKSGRAAFAALSEEMIKVRNAKKLAAPAVAYCPMEKKSWLQARGPITNPYFGPEMRSCGEFK